MTKRLCPSEIEILLNQQNTGDSESSTLFDSAEPLRVERCSSGYLITPEDLGLTLSSGLNNQNDVTEDLFDQRFSMLHAAEDQGIASEDNVTNASSDHSISILQATQDPGIASGDSDDITNASSDHSISILHATKDLGIAYESNQVLSPIPIFENLSDDSDDDPDWVPVISRRRRSFYPLLSQVEEHLDID